MFQERIRMLTEQEAQALMVKLVDLREKIKETDESKRSSLLVELHKHEQLCMEKFRYLVTMKTGRYKAFSNYDDLNQEGFEALIKSMNNTISQTKDLSSGGHINISILEFLEALIYIPPSDIH